MKKIIDTKNFICILISFLPFAVGAVTPPSYAWVQQSMKASGMLASCIAADDANQVIYATGFFSFGGLDFGTTHLLSPGSDNTMFLAKYTMSGTLVWVKVFEGVSKGDDINGIAVDIFGNIFVTGYNLDNAGSLRRVDTIYFGNSVKFIDNNHLSNGFLVKFDKDGTALWATGGLGDANSEVASYAVATDIHGNVYMTGGFVNTAHFGNTTLTTNLAGDLFVAKYDKNGNLKWAIQNSGVGHYGSNGYAIAIDKSGNCIVGGDVYNGGPSGRVVEKLDSSGNLIWYKNDGVWQGPSVNHSVSCDDAGNIYLSGNRAIPTVSSVNTAYKEDLFIEKLNSDGDSAWMVLFDSSLQAAKIVSKADASGNLYTVFTIAPHNQVAYTFGNFTAQVNTSSFLGFALIPMVIKWTTDGQSEWGKLMLPGRSMFSFSTITGFDITVDNNKNVYFTGTIKDTGYCESFKLVGNSAADFYLAKLGTNTTSLNENNVPEPGSINIYPNPSSGILNIHFGKAVNNSEISIYDLTGKLIFKTQTGSLNDVAINKEQLSPGTYLCRIVSSESPGSIPSVYSQLIEIR